MAKRSRSKSSAKSRRPSRPRKTSHRFTWRGITLRADHTPNYINDGWSHIELRLLAPKGAPVPITSTGYLSHFLSDDDLLVTGGAVSFFTAWLDRDARSKAWVKTEAAWRQGDLFARRE